MSPWSDVSDKSTTQSSVRSFHSGTKVPVTSCRKRRMRQTSHLTSLAVRGLLKVRKVRILNFSFHVISFFWQVESQSPCMMHAQITSLISIQIDLCDLTIFAGDARPITVISCADCKTPRFGIQCTSSVEIPTATKDYLL